MALAKQARVAVAAATCLLVAAPTKVFSVAHGCAIVATTPDGFLSVRDGPSTAHRELLRLQPGQVISIDDILADANGKWWHVTGVHQTRAGLKGIALDGWAHGRYLRPIECP